MSRARRAIENALKKLKSDSAIDQINGRLDLRNALAGGLKCSWYQILSVSSCPITRLSADGLCSVGDGADLVRDAHSGGSDAMRWAIEWAVGDALGRGVMPDLPVAEPKCPSSLCPNEKSSRPSGSCRSHVIGFPVFECTYSLRKTCDALPSPPALLAHRFSPRAGATAATVDNFNLPESCPGFGTIEHCVCGVGAKGSFNAAVQRSHQATATIRLTRMRNTQAAALQAAGKLCPDDCEAHLFEPRPKPSTYNDSVAQSTLASPGWCFCSEMPFICFWRAQFSMVPGGARDWIDDLRSRPGGRGWPQRNEDTNGWIGQPARGYEFDEPARTDRARPTGAPTAASVGSEAERSAWPMNAGWAAEVS